MSTKEYRLRFDAAEPIDEQAIAFFKKRTTAFILVHHTTETENPHYHAYVVTHVTQGNFSNYLKKEFKVTGADFSCKTCLPDRKLEYWSYLFNTKKGNIPRLVSFDGVSLIDVKTAQETANTIAKEFETRMASVKKLTKFDIAERLSIQPFTSLEQLYDDVLKLLHDNRMCSATFVIKDIISTVLHINGDSGQKKRTLHFFQDNN